MNTEDTVQKSCDKSRSKLLDFFMSPELWLVLLAAATRLIPHPPNFTAIGALAIFAGAALRYPWIVAFAALLASDLILGFHDLMPFVYGAFAISVGIAWLARRKQGPAVWTGITVGSSLIFFFVTNFGVWLYSSFYEKSAAGLLACLTAALPFYRSTLLGDLLFTAALFGILKASKRMGFGTKHLPIRP